MEIERKWMVTEWPQVSYPVVKEIAMRQGYVSVYPTVRIREEARSDGPTQYVLCFKSAGGLSRKEIEMPLEPEKFRELEDLIGLPLIPKRQKVYALPGGLMLEVNLVDEGMPTAFMYAEIEYPSEQMALSWDPASCGLAAYLSDEVTGVPGQSMGAYWERTRTAENA